MDTRWIIDGDSRLIVVIDGDWDILGILYWGYKIQASKYIRTLWVLDGLKIGMILGS